MREITGEAAGRLEREREGGREGGRASGRGLQGHATQWEHRLRKRERETDRQTDRQIDRQAGADRQRQAGGLIKRHRDIYTCTRREGEKQRLGEQTDRATLPSVL